MKLRRREARPSWAQVPGDRVLAAAVSTDATTWLLGTRAALHIVREDGVADTWPWETIQAADWDADERQLRVALIGS
ncbi:MAG: hypothetical protein EOO74_08525, partial [Myxococcales bacterium]